MSTDTKPSVESVLANNMTFMEGQMKLAVGVDKYGTIIPSVISVVLVGTELTIGLIMTDKLVQELQLLYDSAGMQLFACNRACEPRLSWLIKPPDGGNGKFAFKQEIKAGFQRDTAGVLILRAPVHPTITVSSVR